MWIGLLYSLLCLTKISDLRFKFHGGLPEDIRYYREKAVQCFVLADWTKPKSYAIEAFLFYFACEHFCIPDAQYSLSLVFGLIVRLALRSGLHRDEYPELSVFQREMRRRHWAIILQVDVGIATSFGLPRMVNEAQSDTKLPSNLLDEDLDENMTELPPSRNDLSTPLAYVISKFKLIKVYGSIIDRMNSTEPLSYGEVMNLDARLQYVHHSLPSNSHKGDESSLSAHEITLEILYARSICVLHRRHLVLEERYAYSRRSCISAAMRILSLQKQVSRESQPGGLYHERDQWKFSSFQANDFLLGAMILCLELSRGLASAASGQDLNVGAGVFDRIEMLRALEDSQEVWCLSKASSVDAYKASEMLKIMLRKAKGSQMQDSFSSVPISSSTFERGSFSVESGDDPRPLSLPMPTGSFPWPLSNTQTAQALRAPPFTQDRMQEIPIPRNFDALEGMIESSGNLDWVRRFLSYKLSLSIIIYLD